MTRNLQNNDYHRLVREGVDELVGAFHKVPNFFLTEDDVRCFLYHQLYIRFGQVLDKSRDGVLTTAVHSEVRWYGKSNDQNKRSDIVVLDVNDIRVIGSDDFRLPTKGYGFNNFYSVIEIKLRRTNSGKRDQDWLREIQKDLDTLSFLRTGVTNRYDPLLISINLDKRADISNKIGSLSTDKGIEVVYSSSKSDS